MELSDTNAYKNYIKKQQVEDSAKRDMLAAYGKFLEDCHYPMSKDGSVMDASYVVAHIGYHMVRRGWRPPGMDPAEPVIKKQKVVGPGVIEDAVKWVPMDAPDDPLEHLDTMTFAEISALPEDLKVEAARRLNKGRFDHDLPDPEPSWQVSPNISITDEEPSGEDFLK